jgi:hypothetical protein
MGVVAFVVEIDCDARVRSVCSAIVRRRIGVKVGLGSA